MEYILAPSILSADFKILGEQVCQTKEGGAQYVHFDVMDGMFVPSISFGIPVLKSLRSGTDQVLDVHLMIDEPSRYIDAFADAGADIITVHLEACSDVGATLDMIRARGLKVGLSICPETDAEACAPYLDKIDMLLVMTVHPGFGGQKFIPESIPKIQKVRQMEEDANLSFDVEVDGGIKLDNVKDVLDAGANVIVAGSAVFGGDAVERTKEFLEILENYG